MITQKKLTKRIKAREFTEPLSQAVLDIEEKSRSNIFTWRGQFSPQLVENLLLAYCPLKATILDPFSGSGTVLYESACAGFRAYGYEVNPAAWILSRIYKLTRYSEVERGKLLQGIGAKLRSYYPVPGIFDPPESRTVDVNAFMGNLSQIYSQLSSSEEIVIDALVILLDLADNKLTSEHIHGTFFKLSKVIRTLPFSEEPVVASLADARDLPLETDQIDFLVTSPPYVNVFNYHQNYRRSAEVLGWDLLKIAKSEIGSNRANRGNRFFTVIQYCLDMGAVLKEIQRVCKNKARIIFVVGHESKVLGVPFFNAEIITEIAKNSGSFELALRQRRNFKNKFGKMIREDLLHLSNYKSSLSSKEWDEISRNIAYKALSDGLKVVSDKNKGDLETAIAKIPDMGETPLYNSHTINHYRQTVHHNVSIANASL